MFTKNSSFLRTIWYNDINKDYIGLGLLRVSVGISGTVIDSLCSLLCLPAPFMRPVRDLESQAYGFEAFLDLHSQIRRVYSVRPP